MSKQHFDETYGANPAENYERYFVPAIGAPVASDLIDLAAIRPGERVLDVACGTGVVARRAAEKVGGAGTVVGVDINPAMLAVARASAQPEASIEWRAASAEAMPLPDEAFDVVLCQMGLQFMPDKPGALREMRRVMAPGGRVLLNVPGPAAPLFESFSAALARHIGPEAAGMVEHVFSMHDTAEIEQLMSAAGLDAVDVQASSKTLRLPAPREFLWQYIWSTPLTSMVAPAGKAAQSALERDLVTEWQPFEKDGALVLEQRFVTGTARR